jgi:hypothetical protein
VTTVSAQPPAGCNDPMAGEATVCRVAHDVPDGARGTRVAGHRRHIAVGGDAPARDVANARQDARGEGGCAS